MKKVLLSLMLLVASLASFAYDFEVDGIYYNVLSKDDLTCEVTHGDNDYTGEVIIPSQVSYAGKVFNVTSIGVDAFYNCSGLTSVTIPNSVTIIRGSAFEKCSSLTSCHIGNSVTNINNQAFAYCSSLCSIKIPSSVTYIGMQAFRGCTGLRKAEFASIESLCEIEFYDDDSNPLYYAHNLYIDGNEIKEVVIPNSVTSIGGWAFYGCSSLTSVTIPNSVTSIGGWAFRDCIRLTSITIGNSVKDIYDQAFKSCSGVKVIQCLATTPPSYHSGSKSHPFEGISSIDCVLKVPEESIEAYKAAWYWKDFWNIVALGSEGGGDIPSGEPDKCATPTIALQGGKIVVTTTTKDAECNTSITTADVQSSKASEIELSGVYTITAYASKGGLWNSETATATLVWANPTIEGTGVMSMEMKKALLLRSNGNTITVEGLEEGEMLELYSTNGMMLDKVVSSGTSATLGNGLQKHQIYIIKAGDRSIKYKF